eukprot:scaffold874_cov380-Prasinococcus_capsulatus_cf.AAC.22
MQLIPTFRTLALQATYARSDGFALSDEFDFSACWHLPEVMEERYLNAFDDPEDSDLFRHFESSMRAQSLSQGPSQEEVVSETRDALVRPVHPTCKSAANVLRQDLKPTRCCRREIEAFLCIALPKPYPWIRSMSTIANTTRRRAWSPRM